MCPKFGGYLHGVVDYKSAKYPDFRTLYSVFEGLVADRVLISLGHFILF